MIHELNIQEIEELLQTTTGSPPFPPYEDARGWRTILENPLLVSAFERHRNNTEVALQESLELVPATLYLNFRRTGDRNPHDGIIHSRRSRLMDFVIGECIERKGRFLDAILDHTWAICEESAWVIPAHSSTPLPEAEPIVWIDLVAAETGRQLAEAAYIIGKVMDSQNLPFTRRIRYELERRCWQPYLERDDMWWMFVGSQGRRLNNWTGVCNCGVVGSALLMMDDTKRLAQMIEKSIRSMNDFLQCFDADGGSDEGAGYWGYGMFNYFWLSYLLEKRTEGKISLMNAPEIPDIALFPQRVTLSGQTVANFSDCSQRVGFPTALMFYLGERLNLPQVSAFAQSQYDQSGSSVGIREIAWMPSEGYTELLQHEAHVYFSGQCWMISRADPTDENSLILAAKGGHNAENHNQNDVGNFIVHYAGESLIVDLGAGTYTRDYFSDKRYDILVNSSRGHNVPLVNDYPQPAGRQYAAEVIEHRTSETEDVLELDMKNAYPSEAGIQSLRRRMVLHRSKEPWIEVEDTLQFQKSTGTCICPLYVVYASKPVLTFGEVTVESDGFLRIKGEKSAIQVQYMPAEATANVEVVDLDDPRVVGTGDNQCTVRRIVFDLNVKEGTGRLYLRIRQL